MPQVLGKFCTDTAESLLFKQLPKVGLGPDGKVTKLLEHVPLVGQSVMLGDRLIAKTFQAVGRDTAANKVTEASDRARASNISTTSYVPLAGHAQAGWLTLAGRKGDEEMAAKSLTRSTNMTVVIGVSVWAAPVGIGAAVGTGIASSVAGRGSQAIMEFAVDEENREVHKDNKTDFVKGFAVDAAIGAAGGAASCAAQGGWQAAKGWYCGAAAASEAAEAGVRVGFVASHEISEAALEKQLFSQSMGSAVSEAFEAFESSLGVAAVEAVESSLGVVAAEAVEQTITVAAAETAEALAVDLAKGLASNVAATAADAIARDQVPEDCTTGKIPLIGKVEIGKLYQPYDATWKKKA